jgi:hypothetical protein
MVTTLAIDPNRGQIAALPSQIRSNRPHRSSERLVTRGVLTEDQPGLFTLAPTPTGPTDATVT